MLLSKKPFLVILTAASQSKSISYIAGTFLIDASASFLNGAGLGEGEDRNVSIIKTFREGPYRIPYVSSQAWKRWLRNTLIEETGWNPSTLRALEVNEKGNTNKIGGEFNPVEYAEDDIFGYMRTEKGSGRIKEQNQEETTSTGADEDNSTDIVKSASKQKGKKVRALTRTSPFAASILVSLRKSGWEGRDEGFVHLKEGSPQPYTTQFYNSNLEAIFCLNYKRLGVFSNIGDRIELDETKGAEFLTNKKIYVKDKGKDEIGFSGETYEMVNSETSRRERASALLKALSRLRGGAKQAAFGTDVSPKVFIMAGLTCGNPIFNSLFTDDGSGVTLKVETMKEITKDYADRISTPVYIGIRKGFLKNEDSVLALPKIGNNNGTVFVITTPIDAAMQMANSL